MASLHKDPRGKSPFWLCAFTHVGGDRAFKSTKKTKRKEADEIRRGWQRAVDLAKRGELTEARIHRLAAEICESANVVLRKERAFISRVLNEIYTHATGETLHVPSVTDFLNGWISSKELTAAKGTSKRYAHTVRSFLSHLAQKAKWSLAGIAARDIEAFRDLELDQGKSNKTANMSVKTLRIALNVARRQQMILSNPAEAVDLLPENSVSREPFTRDQVAALLAVADIEWRGMILIGACHGLRIGDAARLTWANVDMERRSIRFFPQKDRRGVRREELEIPTHADVEDYLLALPVHGNRTDAPLFPTLSKKKGTGASGLCNTFARLMETSGIKREAATTGVTKKGRRVFALSYHSFRHTATSELAELDVSKERRMKLIGHKSNVHERYTHHKLATLRKAVEMIPSFLK